MGVATSTSSGRGFVRGKAHISANGPVPRNATLSAALSGVIRARVIRGGMLCGEALGSEVLLDTADPDALDELVAALRIADGSAGQCELCLGDPSIELHTRDGRQVTLAVHHGTHLRWSEWQDDARLASAHGLLTWLEQRGIRYPAREDANERVTREASVRRRWLAAMPHCLVRFGEDRLLRELRLAPARVMAALRAELPEPRQQALALFEWLGNGAGGWTAYPAYELAAERLLLYLPLTALLDCLRSPTLTPAQLEGASRFFAGWHFQNERRADAARLARSDTRCLLEHALRTRDPEKERLARKAFS